MEALGGVVVLLATVVYYARPLSLLTTEMSPSPVSPANVTARPTKTTCLPPTPTTSSWRG
ncbi:hypothetical protein H2248_003913 [Termitomyces sp. 'cryptogamus']|nr:hypothetical protein H2248_003913 [Termitomyces sp. 'cryptogamus']